MRGRQIFSAVRPVLDGVVLLLRLVPRPFAEILYSIFSHLNGRVGVGVRWALARRLCASVGPNVFIGPRVEVRGWEKIRLGANVSIHNSSFVDGRGGLSIGNDVSIAHQCSLVTFEHGWADESLPIRDNPVRYLPIEIADDVWIGCGARVLAGTSIGARSIVAAGAVVARDIPAYSLAGGVPAKVIGSTRRAA
jgi:acetyltransferase-like isoleucine patch superfamily enzyme